MFLKLAQTGADSELSRDCLVFELARFGLGFQYVAQNRSFASTDYRGYSLAQNQPFHDTLHGFTQYLILEDCASKAITDTRKQTKVLIPAGIIDTDVNQVVVKIPSECEASIGVRMYDVHMRFNTLEVAAGPLAVEARLQLAALYAATDLGIPDDRTGRTGGEVAIDLVRQCWTNVSMTEAERRQLCSITRFACLDPALCVLCYEISASECELSCLYADKNVDPNKNADARIAEFPKDAAEEYKRRKHAGWLNKRATLTGDEEQHNLGGRIMFRPSGRVLPRTGSVEIVDSLRTHAHAAKRVLALVEKEFLKITSAVPSAVRVVSEFPIDSRVGYSTKIGQDLITGLKASWKAYQRLDFTKIIRDDRDRRALTQKIQRLASEIQQARASLESEILANVTLVASDAGWHSDAFCMRRAANLEPIATARDLAKIAVDPSLLRDFNPFLSTNSHRILREDCLTWLQLCVSEDQLDRMGRLLAKGDSDMLEREIREVGREWDVHKFPQWLVFEVEQCLKIRSVQHKVAMFLIENPDAITQLNMGEGKTRVILPMLVLALSQREHIMRLHFLSPLLGEAVHFLRRHLTASLMTQRVYELPFHRGMKITLEDANQMERSLRRCMATNGIVCVAPEHRLSLQLKWHELTQNDGSCS